MSSSTSPARALKVQYSEAEAADMLNVSIEELRSLVRDHIVNEDDPESGAVTVFQQSDLLVLRILAGMAGQTTSAR